MVVVFSGSTVSGVGGVARWRGIWGRVATLAAGKGLVTQGIWVTLAPLSFLVGRRILVYCRYASAREQSIE